MFINLRKKFTDVLQESRNFSESISNGLRSPTAATSPNINKTEFGISSNINLCAGSEILQKNEEAWKELHDINEKNASKAAQIDETIKTIKERREKQFVEMTELQVGLGAIPLMVSSLEDCGNVIERIDKQCQILEVRLTELMDSVEQMELQERQFQHKLQISMYKEKKMNQLEIVRQRLAAQHQENIKKYENYLRKIQQERQAVFQDAFQHDIDVYKEQGRIPKFDIPKKPSDGKELTLEEVTLDDSETRNEFEEFLND